MSRRRFLPYKPPSAAGERIFVADMQGGISYSDDNGETWTRVTVSGAPTRLLGLARNPNTGTICASGYGYNRIMRSVDNGESYEALDYTASRRQLSALMVDGEDKWFLCGDDYDDVYTSSDDAATWSKPINFGVGGDADKRAGAYHDGLYIIAATGDNYWTSTNGTTWTRRTDMGAHVGIVYRLKFVNGLWWACGQGRLAYSATGTGSRTEVNVGANSSFRDIVHDGSVYIASGKSTTYGNGGVFMSSDGATWTLKNELTGFTFWGLHVTQTGRLVATAAKDSGVQGVIYTTDNLFVSDDVRANTTDYNYTRLCG